MARVIISSGHSTQNPGSVSNGLREYDVARQIAKSTLKFLRQNGVISLSVPPEMELIQRIDWINNTGYLQRTNDVSIEIHVNDGGKSGIEAWFEGEGINPSQQLTELILDGACAESKLPSQGAKSELKHEIGSIAFLHETNTIGSLIECGYIDNVNDATFLKSPTNIDLLGKGIAKGICKFLKVEFRELPTTTPVQNQTPAQPTVQQSIQPQVQIPQQSTPPSSQTTFQPLPSREERKKMIVLNYVKILGREPSQNDINYFLNVGIREEELLRKMVESQEHADIVKTKQEFDNVKEQFASQQSELEMIKASLSDQNRIIEGLNYSIMEKNTALQNLQQNISLTRESTSQIAESTKKKSPGTSGQYRGSFLDRLFKAFSDLFE